MIDRKMHAEIARSLHKYMHNAITPLNLSRDEDQDCAAYGGAYALVNLWAKDEICRSRLVFDGHEDDSIRSRWPLTKKYHSGHADPPCCRGSPLVAKPCAWNGLHLL